MKLLVWLAGGLSDARRAVFIRSYHCTSLPDGSDQWASPVSVLLMSSPSLVAAVSSLGSTRPEATSSLRRARLDVPATGPATSMFGFDSGRESFSPCWKW